MKPAHNEFIFLDAINKGYLRVDDEGKIWRIADRNNCSKFRNIKPVIAGCIEAKGYRTLHTQINGFRYHAKAHRIVWIYFNGKIPVGLEINHKNGIKSDNRLSNLELITPSQNQTHSYRITKTHIAKKGENNSSSKLKEFEVKEILRRFELGEKRSAIAQYFNISYYTIWDITKRRTWRHI